MTDASAAGTADVRRLLEEGIADGTFTCAAAAIGGRDLDPVRTSVGESDPEYGTPITPDTRFDLASLTKPIVTTTLVFQLLESGYLSFDETIGEHLPALSDSPRAEIPIHTLLTHTSGLQPYAYEDTWDSRDEALDDLFEWDLVSRPPGERFEYSCLNFVHLEAIITEITGESLSELARRRIFDPVGMSGATMGPPELQATVPVAATYDHEHAEKRLVGETNDPIARAMGGYSGNAGLFATLEDVIAFAETVVQLGATPGDRPRLLSPASVRSMRTERARSDETAQGYGWRTPIGRTPAPIWSEDAIGHTGYTGTSLWFDFENDFYAVLLTNAVYEAIPDLSRFRQRYHAIAASIATERRS